MGWANSSVYFERKDTTKESFLRKDNNFRYKYEHSDFSRKRMHRDKVSKPMGQVKNAPILQHLHKQRKLN
jgi:hypothetical protein